jgi:Kef-type K+ transport system membrane component KefB/nucleotide-binding universal stress UspA family protein
VRGKPRSAHRLVFMALIVAGALASMALAGAEVMHGGGGPYGYGAPPGGGASQGGLGSIKPLSGHELLLVLLQFGLLLLVARALGEVATRFRLPSVVGELLAGLVLGPTLLGSISNDAFEWLFPPTTSQFHLLEVISWLGVIMLLILTGLETDVKLIAQKGKGAAAISAGGIIVPFATGMALGYLLPAEFIAKPDQRLVFALFIGTAMSISAIPVIAKVMMEMNVIRRDIGQVTLAAGMIDDTVGWILLSVVAGMAKGGGGSGGTALKSVIAVAAVLMASFTLGRKLVPAFIRLLDNHIGGEMVRITGLMVLALGWGALTHALQLEAVLGAFIVGILVGEVKRFDPQTRRSFEHLTLAVFAPVFFATAGLRVDLGALFQVKVFIVALIVLAVAIAGKFAGAYIGSRLSRLGHWEALSMGAGMNARGAMEIILATIGLSVGVLTQNMYSIIVVTAIVTSLMAPPMLRWTLGKVEIGEEEQERLDAEERRRGSFVANLKRILLPTTGTPTSRLAARLVGLLTADQDVEVTAMYVSPDGKAQEKGAGDKALDGVQESLDLPKSHVRRVDRGADEGEEQTYGDAVLAELEKGFDLLVIGSSGRRAGSEGSLFSNDVDRLVQDAPCPVLIVRTPHDEDADGGDEDGDDHRDEDDLQLRRILLPVTGDDADRYAAEVAFGLARDRDVVVDVVHVVRGGERRARLSDEEAIEEARGVGEDLVGKIAELGHTLGATVHTEVTVADHDEEAIVDRAESEHVDLVVMASSQAAVSQRAFFGHRVDYVVRHAPCPVLVVST